MSEDRPVYNAAPAAYVLARQVGPASSYATAEEWWQAQLAAWEQAHREWAYAQGLAAGLDVAERILIVAEGYADGRRITPDEVAKIGRGWLEAARKKGAAR